MSRGDLTYFESQTGFRDSKLNQFFVKGEGISREVLQKEIRRYLGPGAYAAPSVYNRIEGYIITAVRPFTPEMLNELMELSSAYEKWVRDRGIAALSYEDFEACRREEVAFAESGTGYASSQGNCQAENHFPTAGPWSGYPPPHGSMSDSERSNRAGHSGYWSATGVNCQQDVTWDSGSTLALSLSSRTNDLGGRQHDPRGKEYPLRPGYLDPQISQSREYAPSQENACGCSNAHSSDYSMSSRDAYRSQFTCWELCSSCQVQVRCQEQARMGQKQARMGSSITLCTVCRAKIASILDLCDKSSEQSSSNSAVAMLAGVLVGVVAGGIFGAEYMAGEIIRSLRR